MRHRTEFLALLIACAGQWPAAAHAAESPVEFLVAASRTDRTVIPGASLRRPADFLLQRVKVSSDAPEAAVRRQEILQTLRLLQDAANRDKAIDLCVLLDNRIVAPMKIDPATMRFGDGPRAQTSEVSIAVKTKVVAGAVGATALFAKLKEFPTTVKPVGRAAVDVVLRERCDQRNALQQRRMLFDRKLNDEVRLPRLGQPLRSQRHDRTDRRARVAVHLATVERQERIRLPGKAADDLHLGIEERPERQRERVRVRAGAGCAEDELPRPDVGDRLETGVFARHQHVDLAAMTADPVEFHRIEFHRRILEQRLDVQPSAEHADHEAVLRRRIVELVCRDHASGARHVLDDDVRFARDVLGERPRVAAAVEGGG